MSELSPAARAILEAVTWKKYDVPPEGLPAFAQEMAPLLATALRAAADQVVPPALEEEFNDRNQALPLKKMVEIRQKLNAIADELKAQ
jgi:hypothetical protein